MRALAILAVVLACAASANAAPATPAKRVAGYCSRSGDLCFGIFDNGGLISLRIDAFARYFPRYRLCVRPPRGAETCRSFPIRRSGSTYTSSVRWDRNFPNRGPGRYRATWRLGTNRLGPTLSFRVT